MKILLQSYFQWDVFKQLMQAQCVNLREKLTNEIISYYVWAGCTLFIAGHFLQAFGMSKDFGAFQLCGIMASIGLFDMYSNAVSMVADFENDHIISYYLSLPTSVFTVLVSKICYWTMLGFATGLALLPLAKIILWKQFVLSSVTWLPFLGFLLLLNAVFATVTFLVASLVPAVDKFDRIWVRVVFPLWFLGGFQFSWASVHSSAPWFSYLMLFNPMTYTTEGMRAALLGLPDSLPIWLCSSVMIALWVVVGKVAYKALKKRLDFV